MKLFFCKAKTSILIRKAFVLFQLVFLNTPANGKHDLEWDIKKKNKRRDLKDQSLCHIYCISLYVYQLAGRNKSLPAPFLFLDEVTSHHVVKETCKFIPLLFFQIPFFDYLLEFSTNSVTDLGLCTPTMVDPEIYCLDPFQTRLAAHL